MESQQTDELLERDRDVLKGCKNMSKDCKDRERYPESAMKGLSEANLGQTLATQIQKVV